jgi:thiol-disulfide isomerase/thioredoxin
VGPPAPVAPAVRKAPDFELKDPKGAAVSLASLKGNVVVLEFAGTWCLPLRDAHPELEALTKDYAHHPVKVYMLDVREKSSANAIDDLSKGGFTFGLLLDADPVARLYDIKTYPSYAIVDKEGTLKEVVGNYAKYDTMNSVRDAIESATGGPPVPKPENPNPAPKPDESAVTPAPAPATPAPAKSPIAPTKTPSMPSLKNPSAPPKK